MRCFVVPPVVAQFCRADYTQLHICPFGLRRFLPDCRFTPGCQLPHPARTGLPFLVHTFDCLAFAFTPLCQVLAHLGLLTFPCYTHPWIALPRHPHTYTHFAFGLVGFTHLQVACLRCPFGCLGLLPRWIPPHCACTPAQLRPSHPTLWICGPRIAACPRCLCCPTPVGWIGFWICTRCVYVWLLPRWAPHTLARLPLHRSAVVRWCRLRCNALLRCGYARTRALLHLR